MNEELISEALLPASGPTGARLGHALLWQPRFVRDDKMLWHVPFLFWLLEAIRPRQYVEIGVGEGIGYMAVCQALHRMRASCRCYAIGEWKNADGQPSAPDRFAARNADLYGDFSEILAEGIDRAADSIENGSVDLMLIDLTTAPTVAASLHRRWCPKLSENGILLINGVDRSDEATTVLVNAFSANSPTVRLPGGDGLLVVLPSGAQDEFSRLSALAPRDPGHKAIIDIFTRLGAGTYLEVNVKDKDRQIQALTEKTKELWKARENVAGQLQELRDQYESRHRKIAMLQSREFDLQQAIASANAETERALSELGSARAEQDKAQAQLKTARAEAEQNLQRARADAQQRDALIKELLQKASEEHTKHQERLAREIAGARAKEGQLDQQLKSEQSARAEAEQAREAAAALADQEKNARAAAEAQRDEALELREQEAVSRIRADEERSRFAAEAEMLRNRLTELVLEAEENYRAMRSLIEIAEQNENVSAALSEELRLVRKHVHACLGGPIEPPQKVESDASSS